jgi:hypothetical protein
VSALCGCSKRLNASSEEKFFGSYERIVKSMPAEKQDEFHNGMNMIWFYSESKEKTYEMLDGKTGEEVFAIIEEMNNSLPKLDTSSKEAFENSLRKIGENLPSSKEKQFNEFVKDHPYKKGDRDLEQFNGLPFHLIVKRIDEENGKKRASSQK